MKMLIYMRKHLTSVSYNYVSLLSMYDDLVRFFHPKIVPFITLSVGIPKVEQPVFRRLPSSLMPCSPLHHPFQSRATMQDRVSAQLLPPSAFSTPAIPEPEWMRSTPTLVQLGSGADPNPSQVATQGRFTA